MEEVYVPLTVRVGDESVFRRPLVFPADERGFYIPQSLGEASEILVKAVPKQERDSIARAMKGEGCISDAVDLAVSDECYLAVLREMTRSEFGGGGILAFLPTWMIAEWKLDGASLLARWFSQRGINDPNRMSDVLIYSLLNRIGGRETDNDLTPFVN